MPLRIPISIPYTIGTDIVRIKRIHDLVFGKLQNDDGKRLSRFLGRILHPMERQDFDKRFPAAFNLLDNEHAQESNHDPIAQFRDTTGSWLAGRWAAKEAAKKAWGAQTLGFKDVRVEICEGGEVQIVCHGWKASAVGQPPEEAEQVGRLSISHDGEYAVAMVIATPLQITTASLPEPYNLEMSQRTKAWEFMDQETGVTTRHRAKLLETAQVDADAMNDLIDLDGSTLQDVEDKAFSTSSAAKMNCLVEKPISDDESDLSVEKNEIDAVAKLQAVVNELSRATMVNNLIAAVTLKGVILPNAGDFIITNEDPYLVSALATMCLYFDDHGGLLSLDDPAQQANQFAATIISVLLKKKDNLKHSLQRYSVNAFLCTAAELIPQLSCFASAALSTSEHHNIGVKTTWKLVIWIVETAVNVDYGFIPLRWTEAGIVALENLDKFALHILEEAINSAPNTVNEHFIARRYVDTDWLKSDLTRLRRVAFLTECDNFESGYFMKNTVTEMEAFLDHAADQIEKGRKWAEMSK